MRSQIRGIEQAERNVQDGANAQVRSIAMVNLGDFATNLDVIAVVKDNQDSFKYFIDTIDAQLEE